MDVTADIKTPPAAAHSAQQFGLFAMRSMISGGCWVLIAAAMLAGCTVPPAARIGAAVSLSTVSLDLDEVSEPGESPFAAPQLDRVIRVYDGRSGEHLSWSQFLTRLQAYDAVFLGETHLDETTHRVEWEVCEHLAVAHASKLIIAMEMFTRKDQPTLDAYIAGDIDETEFLKEALEWGNYRTGYRPMVELARRMKLPLVGSNMPRQVQRKIGFGGAAGMESLEPTERAWVAAELHDNSEEYWKRFERVVRGHAGMLIGNAESRLYSTQSLWDNTMGESCALAMKARPGFKLVHINGGFHTAFGDGTAAQFRRRHPDAKMVTVDIRPSSDLPGLDYEGEEKPSGDFVLFADARSSGLNEGTHAVTTARELQYFLSIPEQRAESLPLLVWLGSHDWRAEDSFTALKLLFGDTAAIAVIVPPFPQIEETLHRGGRWYFEDDFREHLGPLHGGVHRVVEYLGRYFDIDPQRIVIAGQGAGATAVANSALYEGELQWNAIAWEPQHYKKLREGALPADPPSTTSLRVIANSNDLSWWQEEAQAWGGIGYEFSVEEPRGNVLDALRTALEIPDAPTPKTTVYVVPPQSTPLATSWFYLFVLAQQSAGNAVQIVPPEQVEDLLENNPEAQLHVLRMSGEEGVGSPIPASRFADAKALPLPPGSFGGTVVVVLPASIDPDESTQWKQLAEQNVLQLRSRFSRLRLAHEAPGEGEASLESVLVEIRDSGRSNVLVVPARFCADADTMRALRASAGEGLRGLQVHWLPGLGGKLYRGIGE